jgi:hypothetical protein
MKRHNSILEHPGAVLHFPVHRSLWVPVVFSLFGFLPKFSTTVENAVENRVVLLEFIRSTVFIRLIFGYKAR